MLATGAREEGNLATKYPVLMIIRPFVAVISEKRMTLDLLGYLHIKYAVATWYALSGLCL
jgi:hypothetical protein